MKQAIIDTEIVDEAPREPFLRRLLRAVLGGLLNVLGLVALLWWPLFLIVMLADREAHAANNARVALSMGAAFRAADEVTEKKLRAWMRGGT